MKVMHTITKNILALMAFALVGTSVATAQTTFPKLKIGENPRTLNVNAVLELESANKGFLLPRVELEATDLSAPLTAHVAGMTVYNTVSAGTGATAVTPGYYYNDGGQWVRIAAGTDIKPEPWFDQATNTEATDNEQDIYQMGSVSIGKDAAKAGAALDVAGAVRGGTDAPGTVGANSAGFGEMVIASGENSFAAGSFAQALGKNTVALGVSGNADAEGSVSIAGGVTTGANSVAIGYQARATEQYAIAFGGAEASGEFATAMGRSEASGLYSLASGTSTASGEAAVAMGMFTTSSGVASIAMGSTTIATSSAETVMGRANAITTGTEPHIFKYTDPLFQVGNGNGTINPSNPGYIHGTNNALTVLKNGNTAIGIMGKEEEAKPTERLDIGRAAGDYGNKGSIRIRAINTPQYTSDVATDRVIVADADGVLKSVERSALAPEYVEPWQIIGGTNKATANTDHIYQMGRIAIGTNTIPDITVGASTITPQLHVAGDVSTTGKFWTTNSVYADYVFEKYFDGASDINKEYEFKSLDYVKAFISENKHLPGVTKIDDLLKDENGYLIDMTALSIQQLEKIEELFLHTIEQQELINKQQQEIEAMKVRLERLEKLLNTEK